MNSTIKLTIKGTVRNFQAPIIAEEICRQYYPEICKDLIAVRVNDCLRDLSYQIEEDATIEFITSSDPEGLQILRHSTSHVMAQAVKELYPDIKLAIGPAIDIGFYYDFDRKTPFSIDELEKIEQRMKEIIDKNLIFRRKQMSKKEAIDFFSAQNECYKVELLEEIDDEEVSVYQQGDFVDLCVGPHLPSTGKIKAFKLLNVAGAYWRGDERRIMLQRIYGTAFFDDKVLQEHMKKLEEVLKRDHRKLGRELELYSINEEAGPGLILWHPRGATVRMVIEDFWRKEHLKAGYQIVNTPHIAKVELWKVSGHWEFYRENMYPPIDVEGQEYLIKPMNCPFHILIYKNSLRSYKEFPICMAELGTVYRFERSGVLHGLMRVRGFTQDDAHIFCRPDQLNEEINKLLDFVLFILKAFGFYEYETYLSTRPEKFVGSLENWEKATDALKKGLEHHKLPYKIDPGAGVFYGPKIDIKIKDLLGRSWQCTTIQIDFNFPERFELYYINEKNQKEMPIMIHRALLGSLERFLGVLIEHYGGAFPLWLSPVQVKILPIAERHLDYAQKIKDNLWKKDIRVEVDVRNEKLGLKIREAQLQKVPYMLIVGDKEVEMGTVSVRKRGEGDIGAVAVEKFIENVVEEAGLYQ